VGARARHCGYLAALSVLARPGEQATVRRWRFKG
jgi:hypothetical protein